MKKLFIKLILFAIRLIISPKFEKNEKGKTLTSFDYETVNEILTSLMVMYYNISESEREKVIPTLKSYNLIVNGILSKYNASMPFFIDVVEKKHVEPERSLYYISVYCTHPLRLTCLTDIKENKPIFEFRYSVHTGVIEQMFHLK